MERIGVEMPHILGLCDFDYRKNSKEQSQNEKQL